MHHPQVQREHVRPDGNAASGTPCFQSILALTDLSARSQHAVERAARLAADHGALLKLMYAPSSLAPLAHAEAATALAALARAMGAQVSRNLCANIGWSPVWVTPPAQQHMGLARQVTIFNWHYDTFEIPVGAVRTMYGSHCLNKGFIRGKQWGFQGHLEVTEESVRNWCAAGRDELLCAHGPAVQSREQILDQLPERIAALRLVADQTYAAWTRQLDRPLRISVRVPAYYG
jgi:hypothetical protein